MSICCRIMLDPCNILLVMNVLYTMLTDTWCEYSHVLAMCAAEYCCSMEVIVWKVTYVFLDCYPCIPITESVNKIFAYSSFVNCIFFVTVWTLLYMNNQTRNKLPSFLNGWKQTTSKMVGVCTWNGWTSLPQPRRG